MRTVDFDSPKHTFSGHDTFHCRPLWLKKGYDFVRAGGNFNNEDAVVQLGVGKNMVSSIRYWLKAFNLIDQQDKLTQFSQKLFDDENGYDPFLEDETSLWLLHYHLVKTGHASIYNIIFNELRKEKLHFNRDTFVNFIKRTRGGASDNNFNENTLLKDFDVFTKMYKGDQDSKDVEDISSGFLSEIDILKIEGKSKDLKCYIENNEKDSLNEILVLYTILDNPNYSQSISLNSLEFDSNSPGSVFALSRSGLLNKISDLTRDNKNITFTDHAGIKELQLKKKVDAFTILDSYYGK